MILLLTFIIYNPPGICVQNEVGVKIHFVFPYGYLVVLYHALKRMLYLSESREEKETIPVI